MIVEVWTSMKWRVVIDAANSTKETFLLLLSSWLLIFGFIAGSLFLTQDKDD